MAEAMKMTNELEDKKEFLRMAAQHLDLRNIANEEVLYLYCGSGMKYIPYIQQLFPRIRKLYITNIMDSFNVQNIPRGTELLAVEMHDVSKLTQHEQFFFHIVSIDCFHWYKSARNGFNVIHHLLKFGGSAAILIHMGSPFHDCYENLIENTAWKFSDLTKETLFPKFPPRLSESGYRELAENVGFTVVACQEYYRIYEFPTMDEFYAMCKNFTSPLLAYLPKDQHESFENDYNDKCKEINGVSYRGNQRIKCRTLSIFLHKPTRFPPSSNALEDSPPPSASPTASTSTSSPYTFSNLGGRF